MEEKLLCVFERCVFNKDSAYKCPFYSLEPGAGDNNCKYKRGGN